MSSSERELLCQSASSALHDLPRRVARLQQQDYMVQTMQAGRHRLVLLVGGSDVATLYAAYDYAAHVTGVAYSMEGDAVPGKHSVATESGGEAWLMHSPNCHLCSDRTQEQWQPLGKLPIVNFTASPTFETRGLQPFHDFFRKHNNTVWFNIGGCRTLSKTGWRTMQRAPTGGQRTCTS